MTRRPPPVGTRFRKGQSGNPRGRPKKQPSTIASAFDVVNEKTLTVTQDGQARELTVDEALQHTTLQAALAGDRAARRQVLKMILKREQHLAKNAPKTVRNIEQLRSPDPENADAALLILGIASRNPERQGPGFDGEQLLLEPWAIQAALNRRRGGKALTDEDVADIKRCARAPDTLRWPRGTKA